MSVLLEVYKHRFCLIFKHIFGDIHLFLVCTFFSVLLVLGVLSHQAAKLVYFREAGIKAL